MNSKTTIKLEFLLPLQSAHFPIHSRIHFWFSAVEGEVYAMASLFTAVIFWAILKWDEEMGEIASK